MPGLAEALKAEGNDAYAAGDNATALGCYERGIALAAGGDEEAAAILHVLHSNASAAAARIDGKAQAAKAHADDAVALKPDWAKGYVRQAGAALLLHRPGDAERALRGGLKACPAVADQAALRQELDRLLQDDGDQSDLHGYLPGTPAQNMRDFQSEYGLRMTGPAALAALPCDAFRYAFLGELQKFKEAFNPEEHISLRAWELRLPLPAVIVSGAQRIDWGGASGHAAILRLVCEAGARVDARDIAGYTALAHATGHHPVLELAKILLEFGANPSQRTRFGDVPLQHAIMAQEMKSVELLLDAGADPFAKDLNGVSVEQVARFSPETLALVHKAQGRHQQNAELVGGGPCWNCGKTGASRRCQACLCALYCDRTCQRQHWKQHKKSCGSSSASGSGSGAAAGASGAGQPVRLLRLRPAQASPYVATIPHRAMAQQVAAAWGMTEGEPRPLAEAADLRGPAEQAAAAARLNEKLFMIKAQIPLGNDRGPMLIYNKSRSYQVHVEQSGGGDAQKLVKRIQKEGWRGCKAYFNAFVDAGTGELVVQDAVLPTQTW